MAQEKPYHVAVSAQTQYLANQSDESGSRFVFAYTITIRNAGAVAAQLISRHWFITDSQGLVQEVRGLGVVGAQPLLQPGESYEYTSGASIATPVGTMRGSYQMGAEDGTRFEAPIPEFTLSVPRLLCCSSLATLRHCLPPTMTQPRNSFSSPFLRPTPLFLPTAAPAGSSPAITSRSSTAPSLATLIPAIRSSARWKI